MNWSVFIATGIAWGLMVMTAYADDCFPFSKSSNFNTVQQGKVIILGQRSGYPYVVVIPGNEEKKFKTVRKCVPDAFISRNRLGTYIHVGAFKDYATAKRLEIVLRSRKLDARVVYFSNNRK
ncbi:hypothetical protein VB711_15920 [Cronbergia sp. UHCC 0137]|uniref:hypothetical protein n=1 Tax=Cronbergia sp. UHCC 0137 TaxID=3110239 RepID=UPI002B1F5047|nr:hypothetical protein [Cronbergia sp. UHCC 0137]MEA5619316.1 hypothetical protein [Cronbergia sp. UHCC 0137]